MNRRLVELHVDLARHHHGVIDRVGAMIARARPGSELEDAKDGAVVERRAGRAPPLILIAGVVDPKTFGRPNEASGGSRHLHEAARVGDLVEVSLPRNNFPLAAAAERHLLIAGGIGIAPLMSMIAELQRRQADFQLHYCTRSPERTAFRDALAPLAGEGRVLFRHDDGDPTRGLDIAAALGDPRPGTHLYYCGPPSLMAAASPAAAARPPDAVHYEYFPAASAETVEDDRPFR